MDDTDYDNEMFGDSHNQLVMGLQYNHSLHCKYYGEEVLNERIVHTNSFSLIHFNARSLLKNFNAIVSCVKNLSVNFDITVKLAQTITFIW